jgi:hypothetical protein
VSCYFSGFYNIALLVLASLQTKQYLHDHSTLHHVSVPRLFIKGNAFHLQYPQWKCIFLINTNAYLSDLFV